jgi:hypothetical protein
MLIPNSRAKALPLTGRRSRRKACSKASSRSVWTSAAANEARGIVPDLAVEGLTSDPRRRI